MFSALEPSLPAKPGDKKQWGQLPGSSAALMLTRAAEIYPGSSLVVAPSLAEADKLQRQLKILATKNSASIEVFADWETLPYDSFSPHQDIISDRMRCLYRLASGQKCLVIVAASTLLQRLPPREHILGKSLLLKTGQILDSSNFRQQLTKSGYNNVDTVFQHGEVAFRGALIDVFPMGARLPYRIELFDDTIETLRQFDPESQRTVDKVNSIELLPANECDLDASGKAHFKTQWHAQFDVDIKRCTIYRDVFDGLSPAGIEYYLPLFFDSTTNLLAYLPKGSQVVYFTGFEQTIEDYWREIQSRYHSRCGDIERPVLPPQDIFIPVNEVFSELKQHASIKIFRESLAEKTGNTNYCFTQPPQLLHDQQTKNPFQRVEEFLIRSDKPVLFCAESNGRKETLGDHLSKIGVTPQSFDSIPHFLDSLGNNPKVVGLTVANIEEGAECSQPQFSLVSESQIFGNRVAQSRRRRGGQEEPDAIIKNLTELKIGAPVVHIDHGVGRYQGLQGIEVDGQANEFLVLVYADEAKLYVPVANLHLISRYSGAEASLAPMHRLGSDQWQKAKRKATEQIRDVAAELLDLYAKRKAKQGFAYNNARDAYEAFVSGFPFEETEDQETAINAVIDDMLSSQPMDRLVCGDVGFGKTEVAMRAAFIAVNNSKQVVVLVPTTLLAQQHYENFKDRFADWPVSIEVISRFRTSKEIEQIQQRMAAANIDIIIGTHKLIQGGLKFPKLGLLIIDEEHRFGVRQKEAIKTIRTNVDILAMTATPIPRTLNMAMSGIRDLSIIATPPAKRLSVKTFVREYDVNLCKEAILREILRGGQAYYLYNQVQTIEKVARDIEQLIPEARVRVGHGQMRERELEAVMSDFYHKRFNVLVCTTIIETGIDVPSANTIIIDRADKFGLAQLHQLRGRVGRSHHQAYAYLMTPNKKAMTADAIKRLEVISDAQELGAGFTLASHDLEIRGAGELLGDEQSGQMQAIGFSLYMELLDRAVKAIRKGENIDLETAQSNKVEINLRIPALIPDDYLPDVHTRLILYKRLAEVSDEHKLEQLQVEMIDRFGLLPEATKNLFRQTELKLRAERLGISKIEASRNGGKVEFSGNTAVQPLTIVNMVQSKPQHFALAGANQLKFSYDMESNEERLQCVNKVVEQLQTQS